MSSPSHIGVYVLGYFRGYSDLSQCAAPSLQLAIQMQQCPGSVPVGWRVPADIFPAILGLQGNTRSFCYHRRVEGQVHKQLEDRTRSN